MESVGQPSLHLLYWMVLPLGASSVFHHGAVCSGLSHQLMRRRRMQQDVIAGSECGRNSLGGTGMRARLRRIRWERLAAAGVTDATEAAPQGSAGTTQSQDSQDGGS